MRDPYRATPSTLRTRPFKILPKYKKYSYPPTVRILENGGFITLSEKYIVLEAIFYKKHSSWRKFLNHFGILKIDFQRYATLKDAIRTEKKIQNGFFKKRHLERMKKLEKQKWYIDLKTKGI